MQKNKVDGQHTTLRGINNFCGEEPVFKGGHEIPGIQTLKFICAILVVQIHIDSFAQPFLLPLCRIAVPIFFMVTGYFLPDRNGQIRFDKLRNTFKKILYITIWAQCVWVLFTCFLYLGRLELLIKKISSIGFVVRFIVYGDTFGFMLWYLNVLLQSIVLIMFIQKLKQSRYLWVFIPVGLFLNLLLGSYSFTWHEGKFLGIIHRNLITIGMPCVCLGIYLRRYEYKLPSKKWIGKCVLMALGAMTLESYILSYTGVYSGKEGDIIISTIPLAILVFIFFLRLKVPKWLFWTVGRGRKDSLNIYIFHKMVEIVLVAFIGTSLYLIGGFVVAVLTILLSMGLNLLKKSKWIPERIEKIILP